MPTEEGWYVLTTKYGSYQFVEKNGCGFWVADKFGYESLVPTDDYIVAWQKITPFEASKE